MRLERMVAQHGIGADLPEHEIGMRRDDAGCEPRHHLRGLFAVDAAIEHGDVERREALFQLDAEPARIACRRRTRAGAGRSKRSRPRQWSAARRRQCAGAVWRSGLLKRANSAGVVQVNVEAEGGAAAGGNAAGLPARPVERAGTRRQRGGIVPASAPAQAKGTPQRGHPALRHRRCDRWPLYASATSARRLHFIGFQMTGINDLRRQGPANTLVDSPGHSIPIGRRIEVEISPHRSNNA